MLRLNNTIKKTQLFLVIYSRYHTWPESATDITYRCWFAFNCASNSKGLLSVMFSLRIKALQSISSDVRLTVSLVTLALEPWKLSMMISRPWLPYVPLKRPGCSRSEGRHGGRYIRRYVRQLLKPGNTCLKHTWHQTTKLKRGNETVSAFWVRTGDVGDLLVLAGVNELHEDQLLHVLVENVLQCSSPFLLQPRSELLHKHMGLSVHPETAGEPRFTSKSVLKG